MKKRKQKRPSTPASKSADASPATPVSSEKSPPVRAELPRDRGWEIKRDFLKGLLFMVALVPFTVALEHSRAGEFAEKQAYEFLQSYLSAKDIPLAVVNISKLNPVEIQVNGETRTVTPRAQLKQIVEAVIDKGARVVGIDVNFAPREDGELTDPSADPDLFQFCLDKRNESPGRRGVPIVLGVDWANSKDEDVRRPELLVDNPNYKNLFGWMRIPPDTRQLPSKFDDQTGFELPAISAVMANAYGPPGEGTHRWIPELPHWFATQFENEELAYGMKAEAFFVDYSALDALRSREYTLATAEPAVIRDQGGFLEGKAVLIGDGSFGRAVDIFTTHGKVSGVPGIYFHASAVYTLIEAKLYRLTWQGGMLIDSLMSLFILGSISGIRWYYKDRTTKEVAKHRLERLLSFAVGLLAIVFGVWFVNYHRVMWVDFLLVVPLMLLNPYIERRVGDAWAFLRRKGPASLEAVVFESDEEKH
jgi:hypothetical protein